MAWRGVAWRGEIYPALGHKNESMKCYAPSNETVKRPHQVGCAYR